MSEKLYTEAEMQHHAAKEVAKQQLIDLKSSMKEGELRTATSLSELKEQIGKLTALVKENSLSMEKSTDGLRDEIKKDFATKAEVSADFKELNTKIDNQWQKLVLIVSTITAVGVVLQFVLKFMHVG